MTKEALKLALEALSPDPYRSEWAVALDMDKAITAIKGALAEQEQKQPQRTWRPWEGLSADEISDLIPRTDLSGDYGYGDMFAIARLVEYKLKEKNEKTN